MSKALKLRILTLISVIAVLSAFAYSVLILSDNGWFSATGEQKKYNIEFYPDLSETDIMEDPEYISLLERYPYFRLCTMYGDAEVTEDLHEDDYLNHGDAVALLTKMLVAIREGDENTYNSLFSRDYLIAVGKTRTDDEGLTDDGYAALGKENGYTMQRIYDVTISRGSETEITGADGEKYNEYRYIVQYRINKNNGTFRTDMGSDAIRSQLFIITDKNVTNEPMIVEIRQNSVIDGSTQTRYTIVYRVILISAAGALLLGATALVLFRVFGKKQGHHDGKDTKPKKKKRFVCEFCGSEAEPDAEGRCPDCHCIVAGKKK